MQPEVVISSAVNLVEYVISRSTFARVKGWRSLISLPHFISFSCSFKVSKNFSSKLPTTTHSNEACFQKALISLQKSSY